MNEPYSASQSIHGDGNVQALGAGASASLQVHHHHYAASEPTPWNWPWPWDLPGRLVALTDPVARGLMTMLVVSEVHPFKDGNGRTARLAMNCVLSAAGLCRVIVPTIYRDAYLLPLKRLSNECDAGAFIRSMSRIQDWTSRFDFGAPLHDVQAALARCNAFQEDTENYRLTFPS